MLPSPLSLWVSAPHFWVAVGAPAVCWAAILAVHGIRSRRVGGPPGLRWWAVATLATFVGGRWHESADALSLHLVSYVSLLYFLHAYRRTPPAPLEGGALAFFSLLICDIAHAALRLAFEPGGGRPGSAEWLVGVGGAGWGDGLLLLPVSTTLVIAYARWRCRADRSPRSGGPLQGSAA